MKKKMALKNPECGECAHKQYDRDEKEWVCNNTMSENYGLEVKYRDYCEEFEQK